MKPFLVKGYTKRKLHTGNQSVQFDEEGEVERPLFYSTICGSFSISDHFGQAHHVYIDRITGRRA